MVLDGVENLPSGAPGSTRSEIGDAARTQPPQPAVQPAPMTASSASAAVAPDAACGGSKEGVRADAAPDRHTTPSANDQGPGARPPVAKSPGQVFLELAPFLGAVDSPPERRLHSREFDARLAPLLGHRSTLLPPIHAFYEAMSDKAEHPVLAAAVASMRAARHPVRLWTYSPQRLERLRVHGVELCDASEVVPRGLFRQVLAGSGIRYFSDLFRYAVLYEHGGLWMDCDVILLRPFPFRGDHFLNLQWRGAHQGHYICGNVMYAEPYSRHMRSLYEQAIGRFHDGRPREFGDIGPKLLSDYVASEAGAELRERLSSPMLFNPIDWTELDRFDRPMSALADYLNDERVFGIHLWTARNEPRPRWNEAPLRLLLSDPLARFPSLTSLADRFNTDKNRVSGNRHGYARIYDRLLAPQRLSLRRLLEIGDPHRAAARQRTEAPSVALWQAYFPFCQVIGLDPAESSRSHTGRFRSFTCDPSNPDELRAVAAELGPGSLDVIIDDGSHASFNQQLTLKEFFPLLADGGWYFIEDLDWQPPGEDARRITLTKDLLREMQRHGAARSLDPLGVGGLSGQIGEMLFFDSHYELQRARHLGGLAAIRKRGGTRFV